jgi:hypothetical protein
MVLKQPRPDVMKWVRMLAEGGPRATIESQWQANERRLNEIHAMPGLDREMHAAESERLEAAQDAIEFELSTDARPGSRKWSGAR